MRRTCKVLLLLALLTPLLLARTGCSRSIGNAEEINQKMIDAAIKGDTATVKSLLAQGADVNAQNQAGGTALMYAATVGYTATVQALLDEDADANVKDK